eukprot:NODE_9_length_64580_cov_1.431941.p49 type:complete len:120 gc:universal NODE_9_length_64580_cov_1.431941:50524-50883(+)
MNLIHGDYWKKSYVRAQMMLEVICFDIAKFGDFAVAINRSFVDLMKIPSASDQKKVVVLYFGKVELGNFAVETVLVLVGLFLDLLDFDNLVAAMTANFHNAALYISALGGNLLIPYLRH